MDESITYAGAVYPGGDHLSDCDYTAGMAFIESLGSPGDPVPGK